MSPPPSPNILDVTVRDGSFLINHSYTPEIVAAIAKSLSDAGVRYAEISHGCGIGAKLAGYPARCDDDEMLEAAKKAAPDLKLSAFIFPTDLSLPIIPGIVEYIDFGRIGLNIEDIKAGEKVINKLKKYNKKVSAQLICTHAYPIKKVVSAAKQVVKMGVDIVYLVDTMGSLTPQDTQKYTKALKDNVKIPIGFHGHNNINLAISNTLAAWEAGATWLDASLMGVGRGAGNANLETLVQILQSKDKLKYIDVQKLCNTTTKEILPIFRHPPFVGYLQVLLSENKINYTPEDFLKTIAQSTHINLKELIVDLKREANGVFLISDKILCDYFAKRGIDLNQMLASLKREKV